MDNRLRCGLCNRVVKEKTWKEHTQSKEHQYRLSLLSQFLEESRKKFGVEDLVINTKRVRQEIDAPERVQFG